MPLHVYYDTRMAPVTFDFATFLVTAEAYRQSIEISSSYLYIVAPDFRFMSERDRTTEVAEKRWRVIHILAQLPKLIPAVRRVTWQTDLYSQILYPNFPAVYPPPPGQAVTFPYVASHVMKAFKNGLDVQPFQATEHAKFLARSFTRGHDYVTITLRTSRFQPERNSNISEWYKVYKELSAKGYNVWVLPDFEDTFANKEAYALDWPIAHFAVGDLDLRLALYEDALDNLAVNNGICAILNFSKAPQKIFKVVTSGIKTTDPDWVKKTWVAEEGETPEIFQQNQKWIWKDDTASIVLSSLDF